MIVLLLCVACPGTCSADSSQPNIVLIVSDDQTYTDFGFMGHTRVQTPHLDALARQSAVFTNGYVPSSVCRPSLVSILTGLYPHQHGVYFNHPPPGFAKLTRSPEIGKQQFDDFRAKAADSIRDLPTLPRLLAANGYRCLQTGKFWEGHYRTAGFTDGMTTAEPSGGKYGDKVLANGDIVAHGNGDHGLAIGRETMNPIKNFVSQDSDQPFFVWYAPFLPHTPHDSPEQFRAIYDDRDDVGDHERPYFAAISQFDDTVGQLLKFLDQHEKRDNTLIVFVVDNGWQPDANRFVAARTEWDHTKKSKRAPFDAGLRTPILFAWPGKVVASKHDAPVSSIDLLPTILSAASIPAKQNFAGEDLWDVVTGKRRPAKNRPVFGAIYPGDASELGNPSADVAYRWVRQGPHKLIVPQTRHGKPAWNNYANSAVLYDVQSDPWETTNLIDDPMRKQDVQRLNDLLDRWWTPLLR
ncbi:Choline-sulfatase [Planctomycetes bacterium K23_9]|uniref:Choline-sulfatase n=2 Tax=Stieleria marina TaxID=1930275 RepID=A0A517NRN9_9BACT|nr:Choline-sulfatase [Planctomycetes bacterium K23_9]